jgi:hypothetical protein
MIGSNIKKLQKKEERKLNEIVNVGVGKNSYCTDSKDLNRTGTFHHQTKALSAPDLIAETDS